MAPTTPITSAVLNVSQAAAYLGIDKRTLERIAAASGISYVRVSPGRRVFKKSDLDEYLTRRTVVARNTAGVA